MKLGRSAGEPFGGSVNCPSNQSLSAYHGRIVDGALLWASSASL
jgi:hypothetical protein